jgi:two-component system CheB/CheR fusion protein
VIPIRRSATERFYLIVFEDGARRRHESLSQASTSTALTESDKDQRLAQLQRESAATRDYLQSIVQEHEAVKEELKCAHEEVLSANEEFQSTNEELETAKEELQSANEELTTTNDELGSRNRELSVLNARLQSAQQFSEHARAYADVIVESVREPLLVLDSELKVLRANNAFYANFKSTREETEGSDFEALGGGQWNIAALRDKLRGVLTCNETMGEYEVTQSFPSIGERIICLNARKLRGNEERAELILLGVEDVTERRAAVRLLREDARRKDEFLAMLAHELRSPLAPVTHAIHLLMRTDVDPQSAKLHEIIERQATKLSRLVEDLLDVARITRGRIALTRESVDLIATARHASESSRARLDDRKHVLTLVLPATPVIVEGDPIRLEQVVSNLLENAARYTQPGGEIRLTLTEERGEAVLSVADNGIGLAAESLHTIFGLFSQVSGALARSGGGLGIGLNLVQRLLELHGGRIDARSEGLGHGSVFTIRLPLSTPKRDMPTLTTAPAMPTSVLPAHSRRVMVVDDDADSAESMALLAHSWGHEAAVAGDGDAALALARSFLPETALVDIGLPGMDGYELGRRLRAGPGGEELFLIAMTGYGREQDREAAMAAGFDAHIVKPANMDALQRTLANGRP